MKRSLSRECGAVGAALTAAPVLGVVLAGRVCSGAGLTVMAIALLTLLQRRVPAGLQGRAYAGFEVATTVRQTTSIGLGAYLIGVLDYRALLLTEAAVVVLAALLLLRTERFTPADGAGSGGGADGRVRVAGRAGGA